MQRMWFVGVAAAVCVVLAGCSGAGAGSTPASSAAAPPATSASAAAPAATPTAPAASGGTTITGTGYTYSVPKGWDVPKTDVGQSQTDSLAADLTDTDGFSDNVNVIVVKTGDVAADQIEAQAPAQLKSGGFTKVSVEDRAQIAGTESAHLSALAKGAKYRVEQFYLIHDGSGYVITFSFSPKVSKSDRGDVTDSVLSTWSFS